MAGERFLNFLQALRREFIKVAKLDFLNEDGTIAFTLDNDSKNKRSGAFLQDGEISCNLNNGMRRQASITLSNLSGDYDFSVDRIWYGMQVRLSEGLILPDGTEYLIPQGVFEISQPNEQFKPTDNRLRPATDARKASIVCPERIRPCVSATVNESITGTSRPATAIASSEA